MERIKKALNGLSGGILFLVLFTMILIPLSYCLRTNGRIKDIYNGFYALKENTIDVIMIGSSPVYPCLAAPSFWEDYGFTAYPLSSNMQRPKAAKYLVEEARKTQNPDLYVFELRMYLGSDEILRENMAYTRGVLDNMKYSANRIRAIKELVPVDDAEGRLSYYLDIFKYHSNWKSLIQPSQLATFAYNRPHPMKGAVVKAAVGPCEMADHSAVTERMAITEDQELVLRDLINYLKENKLNALFIVTPYVFTEEEQMKYNYISDIVCDAGFDYLNMNDYYHELDICFEEDFADYGTHTNAIGMEKCSEFFGEYLALNYEFVDKRDNQEYADWNEAASLWREEMEKGKQTIREKIQNEDFAVIGEED